MDVMAGNVTAAPNVSTNGSLVAPFCRQVLVQQLGGWSVRLWDLAILLPNAAFLLFLLYKYKSISEQLSARRSPVFKAFFVLVYVTTAVSVLRCVVSMSVSAADVMGNLVDKALWLVLRFFLLSAELCVLTFGLFFGHLDSRTSIRRVLVATVAVSLVYSVAQALLELKFPDSHYRAADADQIDLFSHGGMVFCIVTSAAFALVYSAVCVLPLTPVRFRFQLPTKLSFYVYCILLFVLNLVQLVGAVFIFRDNLIGMCVVDLTTYAYFALYTPVVYATFLRGYAGRAQQGLLFSYRQYKDDGASGEMPDHAVGAYQPTVAGVTTSSLDDLLRRPDALADDDDAAPVGGVLVLDAADYSRPTQKNAIA